MNLAVTVITTYASIGIIVCYLLARHSKVQSGSIFTSLICDIWLLPIILLLWPLCAILMLCELFLIAPQQKNKICNDCSEPPTPIGATAYTTTDLKPTGKVRIGGTLHPAKCAHGFIKSGQQVRITSHQMNEIIVELTEQ